MNKFFAITLATLMCMQAAPSHAQSSEEDEAEIGAEIEEDDGSLEPAYEDDVEPAAPTTPKQSDYSPSPESKPESASGEKIFDWSKYKGAKEVPHPFAEKGLIRITKDDVYHYKVDETPQNRAASFRIGVFNPENLENPETAGQQGASFDENYDQTDMPAVMFDYEWELFKLGIGKVGLRAGTGVYVAQGHGHFSSAENRDKEPREVFTFVAMPNAVGAVYRMQFWDKQLFVPYGEGGGMAFTFGEFRDDDKAPKFGGALAAYYAAGVGFNLTYFDAMSRIQLDREYGINRVYLTVEYRGIVALSDKFDFSSDMFNGGFLMEF